MSSNPPIWESAIASGDLDFDEWAIFLVRQVEQLTREVENLRGETQVLRDGQAQGQVLDTRTSSLEKRMERVEDSQSKSLVAQGKLETEVKIKGSVFGALGGLVSMAIFVLGWILKGGLKGP